PPRGHRRILDRTPRDAASRIRPGDAHRLAPLAARTGGREPHLGDLRRRLRRGARRTVRGRPEMSAAAAFDLRSSFTWLRLGIASVWLVFGLVFKALGAVPRHRAIVARVVGDDRAGLVLGLVAFGEIGLSAWILAGRCLPACMAIQTLAIGAMNALE